jgi:LysR family D-serine deaminase transcriptional activator
VLNSNQELDMTERCYLFNHGEMAYSAARSIAMARVSLVQGNIERGELVAPFPTIEANRGYYLICPHGYQTRAKNKAFIDWLTSQLCTP